MNSIATRLAAASGAFYIVAVFVGSLLMDSSSTTAESAGLVLVVLGFLALVVFVGFLHPILRRAEGSTGWLATVALVAGVLHAATRFGLLGSEVGTSHARADLVSGLEPVNEGGFIVTALLLGLYIASVCGVCLAHRLFPRWLGWFGFLAGALTVSAGIAWLVDADVEIPWPLLASGAWVLMVSAYLAARSTGSSVAPLRTQQADMAGAV